MGSSLGPVAYENIDSPFLRRSDTGPFATTRHYSEQTAYEIDQGVRQLVEEAMTTAQKLLEERKGLLHFTAKALLERETLDREELAALIENFSHISRLGSEEAKAV
jgi:cell division protease FtsH